MEERELEPAAKRKSDLSVKYVVEKVRSAASRMDKVRAVILFGSTVRNGRLGRDLDVAVLPRTELSLLDMGELVSILAETLNMPENRIDLVDLSAAHPLLAAKILKEGVLVKGTLEDLDPVIDKAWEAPDQAVTVKQWLNLDPNPQPDKTVITSRVEEIRKNRDFLKNEILTKELNRLSYGETLALERALHRIIEAMLDICRHLVSVYSLGIVESYGQYPRKLAEAGKIPVKLAQDLAKLAGLRNILVHRYLEIKLNLLYDAAKEITDRIATEFIKWASRIDP